MSKEINNFINEISLDENFWLVNPHFKYLTDFKDLYTNDKSKNKEISSRQLWAIVLYCDITSPFKRMSLEKRKEETLNYINSKFEWKDIEPFFEKYKECAMSEKQQLFLSYSQQMRDREKFIKDTPYKASTYKMLEEMKKNSLNFWKDYQRVEADMQEEFQQEVLKGGRKKSKSERKII